MSASPDFMLAYGATFVCALVFACIAWRQIKRAEQLQERVIELEYWAAQDEQFRFCENGQSSQVVGKPGPSDTGL